MAKGRLLGGDSKSTLYCSFCGKSQHEVRKLIAGPSVFICDECVDLSVDIIMKDSDFQTAFPRTYARLDKDQTHSLTTILTKLDADPLFSTKGLTVKSASAFYLGPFNSPFNEIYSDHIRPCVTSAGISITRADEIFGSRPIMQDIWESIFCSQFIVADLTGKNPNVMYEVGLAHTMGKPVIMLTQDISDVPFDLRHYRCVVYEHTPRGCTKLVEDLANTILALSKVNYRLAY